MKLATVHCGTGTTVALVEVEQGLVWPIEPIDGWAPASVTELIPEFARWRPQLRKGTSNLPLADVRLAAPLPRPPRNIFCVGKNYHDHAHEFTKSGFDSSARSAEDIIPEAPIIFSKVPECVIGHGAAIRYPEGLSDSLDYEAELGVVIGTGGRGIAPADAMRHVFGYTILNDVTARDLQRRHRQWLIGKSLDTFAPMGPWVVTADEVDPRNMRIECWVNGELRQSSNTSLLIFDIPTLISSISAGLTLYPGDVIATGTPAGIGAGFDPPRYLVPGDRIDIEIEGIGCLSNPVA